MQPVGGMYPGRHRPRDRRHRVLRRTSPSQRSLQLHPPLRGRHASSRPAPTSPTRSSTARATAGGRSFHVFSVQWTPRCADLPHRRQGDLARRRPHLPGSAVPHPEPAVLRLRAAQDRGTDSCPSTCTSTGCASGRPAAERALPRAMRGGRTEGPARPLGAVLPRAMPVKMRPSSRASWSLRLAIGMSPLLISMVVLRGSCSRRRYASNVSSWVLAPASRTRGSVVSATVCSSLMHAWSSRSRAAVCSLPPSRHQGAHSTAGGVGCWVWVWFMGSSLLSVVVMRLFGGCPHRRPGLPDGSATRRLGSPVPPDNQRRQARVLASCAGGPRLSGSP